MEASVHSVHNPERPLNTTLNGGTRHRSLWKRPMLLTAVLLLIPLLGNHFVDGWNWELRGFALVGSVLFGTGLVYELAIRNAYAVAYRAGVGLALVTALLLVWVNFVQAADDVNPAAAMYFAVPLVGIVGTVMARFRSAGMARALFATALAQTLVLATALIVEGPLVTSLTPAALRGFGLNAAFAMLFAGSGFLFRKAACRQPLSDVA